MGWNRTYDSFVADSGRSMGRERAQPWVETGAELALPPGRAPSPRPMAKPGLRAVPRDSIPRARVLPLARTTATLPGTGPVQPVLQVQPEQAPPVREPV